MRRLSHKIAVSVPHDLFQAVERVRRAKGTTRSAVLQMALRRWLVEQHHEAALREYEEGYRRKPELEQEIRNAEAAAVALLSTQEW